MSTSKADNTPSKPMTHEGRHVDAVQYKLAGSPPLEDLAGQVLAIDDRVQMLSIFTVTGVNHVIDPKTGNLVRIQTLKPAEMSLFPFDETDPTDDGILRAMLPGVVTSNVPSLPAGDDE